MHADGLVLFVYGHSCLTKFDEEFVASADVPLECLGIAHEHGNCFCAIAEVGFYHLFRSCHKLIEN